jgi:hypothetical protein
MSRYSIEELSLFFCLDDKSPSKVSWNIDRFMGYGKGRKYASKGDSAGYLDEYWKVKFKNCKYSLHNVVYTLAFGNIPKGCVVDHINRNPSDNSLHNLRLIPLEMNSRNRKKSSRNTSNFTGVHLDHKNYRTVTFVCTWYDAQGSKKTKSFSASKYGILEAQVKACLYRQQKIKELNLQGLGYTQNHGQ